jgi:hypothetical protein
VLGDQIAQCRPGRVAGDGHRAELVAQPQHDRMVLVSNQGRRSAGMYSAPDNVVRASPPPTLSRSAYHRCMGETQIQIKKADEQDAIAALAPQIQAAAALAAAERVALDVDAVRVKARRQADQIIAKATERAEATLAQAETVIAGQHQAWHEAWNDAKQAGWTGQQLRSLGRRPPAAVPKKRSRTAADRDDTTGLAPPREQPATAPTTRLVPDPVTGEAVA